jgi:hypothetical protein
MVADTTRRNQSLADERKAFEAQRQGLSDRDDKAMKWEIAQLGEAPTEPFEPDRPERVDFPEGDQGDADYTAARQYFLDTQRPEWQEGRRTFPQRRAEYEAKVAAIRAGYQSEAKTGTGTPTTGQQAQQVTTGPPQDFAAYDDMLRAAHGDSLVALAEAESQKGRLSKAEWETAYFATAHECHRQELQGIKPNPLALLASAFIDMHEKRAKGMATLQTTVDRETTAQMQARAANAPAGKPSGQAGPPQPRRSITEPGLSPQEVTKIAQEEFASGKSFDTLVGELFRGETA